MYLLIFSSMTIIKKIYISFEKIILWNFMRTMETQYKYAIANLIGPRIILTGPGGI